MNFLKPTALVAAAALTLGALSISYANQTPPADSHTATAAQLVKLVNSQELFDQAFNQGVAPLFNQLKESGASEEKINKVRQTIKNFGKTVFDDPELAQRMAELYKSQFSENELKDLIAFYNTPSGKKFLAKQSFLFENGAKIGEEVAGKHQLKLQQELTQILQAP